MKLLKNDDNIKICLLLLILSFLLPLSVKNAYDTFKKFKAFNYVEKHSVRKLKMSFNEANKKGVFEIVVNRPQSIKHYLNETLHFAIIGKKIDKLKSKRIFVKNNANNLELKKSNYLTHGYNTKHKIIGFGQGKKKIINKFYLLSTCSENMIISYVDGMNKISLTICDIDKNYLDQLQVYIYTNLSSESAIPYIFLVKSIFYVFITFFFMYLLVKKIKTIKKEPSV